MTAASLVGAGSPGSPFAKTFYTGTGAARNIETGQNFVSDGGMCLFKKLSSPADSLMYDTERGATRNLSPNVAATESTQVNGLTAFGAGNVTVGSEGGLNSISDSFMMLSWLEQSGFLDIVTYTGGGSAVEVIPHNLGVAPKMIIGKTRNSSTEWKVGHEDATWSKYLPLDKTSPQQPAASEWNNTDPTSTEFTVGNVFSSSGVTSVFYLFGEQSGRSKFGSYTGNGGSQSITGLGFKPKLLILKSYNGSATNWYTHYEDGGGTVRSVELDNTNLPQDRTANTSLDSDGFSLLTGWGANISGTNYIYAAWG